LPNALLSGSMDTFSHCHHYWCTIPHTTIILAIDAHEQTVFWLCSRHNLIAQACYVVRTPAYHFSNPKAVLREHASGNHHQLQKCFLFRSRNDFCGCTTINSPTRNCQFPVGISGCIRNSLKGCHLPLNRVMDSKHLLLAFFG